MTPEAMKAERILVGSCKVCGIEYTPDVLWTVSGFYVGTDCACGPFSRESGYFVNESEAQEVLDNG